MGSRRRSTSGKPRTGPAARAGPLDLHVDSGQRAVREAGLEGEFLKIARPESQAFQIMDKHGRLLMDWHAKPGQTPRPEMDRTALRDMLLDSIRPETIRWDHQLAHLAPLADGRYQLPTEVQSDDLNA